MGNRFVIIIALVFCLCLFPVSKSNAGEVEEVLLGFVIGTSFGLLLSSGLMIIYTNPQSDVNITTMMITGGLIGATGGIILGTFLPNDAVERDPIISMPGGQEKQDVVWHMPSLTLASFKDQNGYSPGLQANVIQFQF